MTYLAGAVLENDVNVLFIFEEMLEPHDVLVYQRFMDFDLTVQL